MALDETEDKAPVEPREAKKAQPWGLIRDKLGFFRPGKRNVIGVQITSTILRMIEIDRSANPPKVINFSVIDPLMENMAEAASQIRGLMHEKGITARLVNSMVCDPGVEHRQVSMPVLGRSEMQRIVRREVKKIVPEARPKDIAFDFWLDKNVKKSGNKSDVLIGVVPRESPGKIITLMEAVELETRVITTVPMTLVAAMGILGNQVDNKVISMIHLERNRSFLVIAKRGSLLFSRAFPSMLAKEKIEEPKGLKLEVRRKFASARYIADKERLLVEVNRSFLYFKQRFRGEGVSFAVLSGEAVNLDWIATEFQQNLGIAAEVFSPVSRLQYQHLGERAGKLERIFPSLVLPLGAALLSVREAKLNFVPPAHLSPRKTRIRRLMMTAASSVLVIVMTTGFLMLRGSNAEAEHLYKRKVGENMVAELNNRLYKITAVMRQRELAGTRRKFLEKFEGRQGPEQELLVALSYLVPDNVVLNHVSLDRPNGNKAKIVGTIEAGNGPNPDVTFNEFYRGLKNSGIFTEVAEARTEIRRNKSGLVELSFKVDCILGG